jgi:alkaline phosphatase D
MSDAARFLAWKGQWNLPFYPDTWDGYPWARERLYELARKAGVSDLVFLTGDSHSFWANRLANAAGQPVGLELGTAGITSPGDFIDSGFDEPLAAQLDQAFTDHNEEIVWTDNLHQGYVRLELSHEGGTASIIVMDTVREPVYQAMTLAQFALTREEAGLGLQRI